MARVGDGATGQISLSLSKTQRDFRLSVALLIAGVVLAAGFYGFEYWAATTGLFFQSPAAFLMVEIFGNVAWVLILVGAIFAGVNWSLLRRGRRAT